MLKYNCGSLSDDTVSALKEKRNQVIAEPTHEAKYRKASTLFSSKNSIAWDEVKSTLAASAPPGEACYYCERDRYRDIDHVRPKRHYPEESFDWDNYVFACAICNQDKKKDTYGVIDATGTLVRFDRSHDMTVPLPVGTDALIQIRREDPLDFLMLDLTTGMFSVIASGESAIRAEFTRDLFELNKNELPHIRKAAFLTFKCYLERYKEAVVSGDPLLISQTEAEILRHPHPTVLVEMRRQIPFRRSLAELFVNVPGHIGRRP